MPEEFVPIKIPYTSYRTSPSHHTQVRCLDYALANGADITLNSYGGLYADSAALKTAISVAEGRGQLFVTAAGNDYGAGLHSCITIITSVRGLGA